MMMGRMTTKIENVEGSAKHRQLTVADRFGSHRFPWHPVYLLREANNFVFAGTAPRECSLEWRISDPGD